MKKLIIIFLILLIAAAVTNPGREDFINWGVKEINSEAETEIQKKFGAVVAAQMLKLQTETRDYVFFSIFSLKKLEKEFKYLGIFDNFFSLNNN